MRAARSFGLVLPDVQTDEIHEGINVIAADEHADVRDEKILKGKRSLWMKKWSDRFTLQAPTTAVVKGEL